MEAKRPLTRTLLESLIEETQAKLDDALARKAYDECAPLQKKVNGLIKKRDDLPTISELKQAVKKAEKAVADAAARRNFSAAASGQGAIDAAKKRLQDALDAEGLTLEDVAGVGEDAIENVEDESEETSPYSSRADLEADICALQKRVDEAIASKSFKDASTLQKDLDDLESLREKYPTVAEMGVKLSTMKNDMESAIKRKDFAKADEIQGDIDILEEKINVEKERNAEAGQNDVSSGTDQNGACVVDADGEKIEFTSRSELEKKIREVSTELSTIIAAKEFKKATATQEILDKLEALRPLLPTVSEMKKKLAAKKRDMQAAISGKDFAKAGELQESIDVLEMELKQEEDKEKENAKSARTLPRLKGTTPRLMDLSSNNTIHSAPVLGKKISKLPSNVATKKDSKPVSKLRPKKPILIDVNDSILSVCQTLASVRGDAAIVPGINGGVSGIITDTDVTRRVVAKHLDPSGTGVSEVMTANPTCVAMSDSAMDALGTMVENHFRHLPVVDDSGAVVGLLDIAKCLNDAISKLEKAQDKSSSAAEDAVKQMASLQGAGGAQAEMLTQLLGGLMSQAFGGKTSPTLRSLLAGKPATVVSPGTNLRDAGMVMAEARKAALVVDEGELVGIFGFKDMMSRAIAKELPLELTAVSSVMTPNPESVSPDTTILEALQIMHDNKFLTLPVCEEDGTVVGLVGVMDLVYGSGGADGWRSIFDSAMDIADDGSDTASLVSARSATRSVKSARSSRKGSSGKKDERPVSKLRPKKPMIAAVDDSVLSVTQMLASKRGDAALVTGVNGGLAGIITDTDVTRRVVAKHLDPSGTGVSEVMTANPTCVAMSDSAMDALGTMVENHFRHLPVVDDSGAVVGLLDIAKCLNDAISKLEKAQDKSSSAAEDAVKQMASLQGAGGAQAEMLTQLLGGLMSQAFGGKTSPTLRSLLAGKPATVVSPGTNLRDAGMVMAEARKAALVVDEGELVGIFGFKDMMSRAIAKELPLELTAVSSVMTPNPESVSPDTTILEALQIMHDNKFLTLPVCEEDGTVVGLVGVMDLVYGSGGADGWRSIFDSAMDIADDGSDRQSAASFDSQSLSKRGRDPVLRVAANTPFGGRSQKNIPIQVEVPDMHSERDSIGESTIQEMNGLPRRNLNDTMSLLETPHGSVANASIDQSHTVFKIVDASGNKYRVRCENRFNKLIGKLSESLGNDVDASALTLTFIDDEGDAVIINSDDCLLEAIENSRRAGHPAVKLALAINKTKAGLGVPDQTLLMAGAGAMAALVIGLAIALKPKS